MNFLKKHYEKLILLLLLVIFVSSMFYVLKIVRESREIRESDLQIPTREPDYQVQNPEDPSFNLSEILKTTSRGWAPPAPREQENKEHYSDLATVFRIVRCPFCKKLIPRSYMEKQAVCPFCGNKENKGEKFAAPPKEGVHDVWIPEDVLVQYKLDPNDPDARFYDIDGDGFSNVYEYTMKTEMGDPHNHPPLWYRLRILEVGRLALPLRFKEIDTTDSEDDQNLWVLKFYNGEIYSIGGEILLDGRTFRIEKAERNVPQEDGTVKDVLVLKEVGGNPNNPMEKVIRADETLRSFAEKVQIEDSANPGRRIVLNVGDQFSLGTRRTGFESYRVDSIDAEDGSLLLADPSRELDDPEATKDRNGTVMRVAGFGQIPQRMRVRARRRQAEREELVPGAPEIRGTSNAPGRRAPERR